MKRVMFAVTALALLGTATTVRAQDTTSPVDFGVAGGISFPMGDLGDFTKTGWNLSGLVGWQPATMPVGFRFDLMYNSFPGKDINTGKGGSVSGPDARTIAGIANVELDLSRLGGTAASPMQAAGREPGTVGVYLTGGVGLYNSKVEDFDSSTDFGINVGAGLNFNLAGMRTFAETRFHNIFSDGESVRFLPVTIGIRFGGPTQ